MKYSPKLKGYLNQPSIKATETFFGGEMVNIKHVQGRGMSKFDNIHLTITNKQGMSQTAKLELGEALQIAKTIIKMVESEVEIGE